MQSLQILAYLSAAANVTQEGDPLQATWAKAYAELTNSSNQYNENLLNLKIETPCDINYSDDELTFLPFFTFLSTCQEEEEEEEEDEAHPAPAQETAIGVSVGSGGGGGRRQVAGRKPPRRRRKCPFERKPVADAFSRTFDAVRVERSSLWSAIHAGVTGDISSPTIAADAIWNLQTWPLDLLNWNSTNEYRQDIVYEAGKNNIFFIRNPPFFKPKSHYPTGNRLD